MKKNVMKIFTDTCVIFSIFVLIICIGIALIGAPKGFGLNHTSVFALFIIGFVISCTNAIYARAKLHSALKYLIHLIVTLSSAAIFMKVVNGLEGSTILVAEVIITVIHVAIFAIIAAIRKSRRKNDDYENVYTKKETQK